MQCIAQIAVDHASLWFLLQATGNLPCRRRVGGLPFRRWRSSYPCLPTTPASQPLLRTLSNSQRQQVGSSTSSINLSKIDSSWQEEGLYLASMQPSPFLRHQPCHQVLLCSRCGVDGERKEKGQNRKEETKWPTPLLGVSSLDQNNFWLFAFQVTAHHDRIRSLVGSPLSKNSSAAKSRAPSKGNK